MYTEYKCTCYCGFSCVNTNQLDFLLYKDMDKQACMKRYRNHDLVGKDGILMDCSIYDVPYFVIITYHWCIFPATMYNMENLLLFHQAIYLHHYCLLEDCYTYLWITEPELPHLVSSYCNSAFWFWQAEHFMCIAC